MVLYDLKIDKNKNLRCSKNDKAPSTVACVGVPFTLNSTPMPLQSPLMLQSTAEPHNMHIVICKKKEQEQFILLGGPLKMNELL